MCLSEVVDISPSSLHSSLWFIQPGISHDVFAYKLKNQCDNIQPWCTPFPTLNQPIVPCPVLIVVSWPAYRFLKRQVRCSVFSIFFRIFQFVVIHTVKGFSVVSETEVYVFWNSLVFFCDSLVVGIWSLVPLPFLNRACTCESSQSTYCWSLGWRILSITLLACEMSAIIL